MDRAIRDCQAAFAWVDNIVICSRNYEEHVGHVRQVLQALQENGLVNNGGKCVCGVHELDYFDNEAVQGAPLLFCCLSNCHLLQIGKEPFKSLHF